MAPRSEDVTLMPINDDAVVDVQPVKAVDGESVRESENEEPIIYVPDNFCSNLFGAILGKKKVCNHCKQTLLNSELRLREMDGETKIYYHPECKTERTAFVEKKQELHNDLMAYFQMKAELERRAELERLAHIEAARRAELERRRESENQAVAMENDRGLDSAPKEGLMKKFSRMFDGCRNNRAVE